VGVSEVYADGVLQKLSMLSWRVGAVLSLNYGLLLLVSRAYASLRPRWHLDRFTHVFAGLTVELPTD